MVLEYTGSAAAGKVYIYGLTLISQKNSLYYIYNGHGDVVKYINSSGAVLKSYDYDAFGEESNASSTDANPFRYAGQYFDAETGTYYLRARYYSPGRGRFTTEDPIRFGLNWYVYGNNNPVYFVDFWGLAPTREEAAAMADHIYGDYNMGKAGKSSRTVAGWRLIDVWYGRETMKMGIYIKDGEDWTNPTEYSVVFKGSIIEWNMETVTVWKNNVEQFLSPKSADMWDAINYSRGFVDSRSQEITFIGHSKGGAEALAAAVATGKNAIVFNPAIPNFAAYNLSADNYSGNAVSYIVKGEALNQLFGAPGVGTIEPLPTQYIPLKQVYTWPTPKNLVARSITQKIVTISQVRCAVKNHLMDAVISGLRGG